MAFSFYLGPKTPKGGFANTPGYDSEGKALSIKRAFWGKATPHTIAFHLAWFTFMVAFWSSFAPAALITSIKKDLNLTKGQIADSNVAAVLGGVVGRLFIGKFMDTFGPRYAFLLCLWGTAPVVFAMAAVRNFTEYALCRFLMAWSLASVIPCIQWTTNMFNVGVVGTAGAIVGGWGNLGGGLTHIAMPLFDKALIARGYSPNVAWRYSFFLPASMHLFAGLLVLLFGQDMPEGSKLAARRADAAAAASAGKGGEGTGAGAGADAGIDARTDVGWPSWRAAILNYRTWLLTLVYAVTFGVEISVDNVISRYFQTEFKLSQPVGGGIGSISGLLNIVSRPSGGVFSDMLSSRFGHRSRITWLFVTAFGGGFFMLLFGLVPSLPAAIVLMILYSFLYEQACGATYSLVPFVSNRSPGLVSGFVSAGGTAGAAIWNGQVFRRGSQPDFRNMGVVMMAVSLLCFFIEWPAWGGIVRGPRPGGQTEQDYYRSEFTEEEQARGLHTRAMNFAHEASVHGGSQHGGSAFGGGSRRGSRTNLSGLGSKSASKADLAGLDNGSSKPPSPDDSARRGGNVAKV